MTLGQFLSAHSPLPTGTVIQHLQALQIGGGGSPTPVYYTGLAVRHDTDDLTVTPATQPDTAVFRHSGVSVLTAQRKGAEFLTARRGSDALDVFLGATARLYVRRETTNHYSKKG